MSVTAVPLQPVKRSYKVWLWLGVLAAAGGAFALAWTGTREQAALHLPADQDAQFLEWHKSVPGVKTTASGLQYQVLKAGTGAAPQDGDGVILNIEGRFRDGTVFQPKSPDQWLVSGQGDRIKGYAEAVKLMNKGSVYRVWIPAALGYGAEPPNPRMRKNAALVFDIEMAEHITAEEIRQMQMQQMMQQQMLQQQQQQQGGAPEGGPPQGRPRQ
jgi:hypothetical protein